MLTGGGCFCGVRGFPFQQKLWGNVSNIVTHRGVFEGLEFGGQAAGDEVRPDHCAPCTGMPLRCGHVWRCREAGHAWRRCSRRASARTSSSTCWKQGHTRCELSRFSVPPRSACGRVASNLLGYTASCLTYAVASECVSVALRDECCLLLQGEEELYSMVQSWLFGWRPACDR